MERPRRPTRLVLLLAAAMAIGGVACAPDPDDDAIETVDATLDGEPLQLLVGGRDGMRGMADFRGADGMLFDLGRPVEPEAIVWVMDRVVIPLDIAWFDDAGRLVGTSSMTPCPAEPCPTYVAPATYRWAVEAPTGAFDDLPDHAVLEIVPG